MPVHTKCIVQYHVCTQSYEHFSYRVSENMFNALNVVVGAHLWPDPCVSELLGMIFSS
jgi:hypothetical protein